MRICATIHRKETEMNAPPIGPQGIVTLASPVSVAETLARLKAAIDAHGLTLFASIDHHGEAERAGLTMQEAHVVIFGSPRAGTPLMVASPLIALELPLRALVWQDQAGQVWVSYTDSVYLAERYGVPGDLAKNIAGIGPLIQGAMQP
jgi:uncharacterized protein (DUF302 family)